jgi:phosphoribosylaminoimidazole-succinocarboxamide synthase
MPSGNTGQVKGCFGGVMPEGMRDNEAFPQPSSRLHTKQIQDMTFDISGEDIGSRELLTAILYGIEYRITKALFQRGN